MANAPGFDGEEFERWLTKRPTDVAIALAARCVLRVAPLLVDLAEDEPQRAFILPLFRGMATPWVAATCPTQGVDWRAARAARAAAFAAAFAAANAADALNADRQKIESGRAAAELGQHALWGEAPNPFDAIWDELKARLSRHEEAEHWSVWIDWYEARLRGDPIDEALEVGRLVEVRESEWEAGPAAANAKIEEIIERFKQTESETLSQRPAAFRFEARGGVLIAEPQSGAAPDPLLLNQILPELAEKAEEYRTVLQQHGQAPVRIARTARKICEALDVWARQPNPGLMLMHLNALEGDVVEYDTPAGREELPAGTVGTMADLARSLQDFVSLYPSIQSLQAAALALRLQRADVEQVHAQLKQIETAVAGSNRIDASATEALAAGREEVDDETALIQSPADDVRIAAAVERRALLTSQRILTSRNFVAQLVRSAQDCAISGVRAGVEGVTSGSIRMGWVLVCSLVAGPVAGIAAVVKSWRPLAGRAQQITESLDEDEGVEESDEDVGG